MDRQYVGIDFHRRRSVIVRLNSAGERLAVARVANDPFEFASAIAAAGDAPAVVIEATYGWYWVVDLLQDLGATVHLATEGSELVRPAREERRRPRHRPRRHVADEPPRPRVDRARGD